MNNFNIDKVCIGEKEIDRLTDENGEHWFPLKFFLQSILCKYDKVISFRDSAMSRYMKVFEYNPHRPGAMRTIKMWFINEKGIKYLLKNMSINKFKKSYTYNARKKGFFEACAYFNVKIKQEIDPIFINCTPPNFLKDYDIWSIICIQNDNNVKYNSKWKKCNKCEYYYPYTERYFGEKPKKDSKCLQCQGRNFKCKNKIIQFIYENDGLDLLYKLKTGKDNEIVNELENFIDKGII